MGILTRTDDATGILHADENAAFAAALREAVVGRAQDPDNRGGGRRPMLAIMTAARVMPSAVLLAGVCATLMSAQAPPVRTIAFDGAVWATTDPEAKVGSLMARDALQLRTGEIWRRDVQLSDGTIEFEMAPQPVRSFLGVMFRLSEENGRLTYEDIYFRPTSSGEWDAVQYEPVFQGIGGWQLYHGEGFTAPGVIPTDRWTRVRIVVSGNTADVYMNDESTPVLRVPELKGRKRTGHVGFWGFFPGGEPKTLFTANFASVRITPAPEQPRRSAAKPPDVRPVIRTWRVAEPVPAAKPGATREGRKVATIAADDSGVVNLNREYPHSIDGDKLKTWASAVIDSARGQRVGLRLGFSDHVRVSLNNELLFEGTNVFRLRYPPSLGLVKPGDQIVYLPLRAGRNELVLEITETEDFGWGFIAELSQTEGILLR